MMPCTSCGASIDGTAAACTSCGAITSAPGSHTNVAVQKLWSVSSDAWAAVRLIAANPVGEIETAYARLGEQRAMRAGFLFGAAFAISMLIVYLLTVFPLRVTPPFIGFIGSLAFGLVPFCSCVACCASARRIHRRGGSVAADVFVSGASLLPLTLLAPTAAVLGFGGAEWAGLLAVFGVSYSAAIYLVGLSRLSLVPDALIAPVVACSVLLSLLLSKVVLSFFGSMSPLSRIF